MSSELGGRLKFDPSKLCFEVGLDNMSLLILLFEGLLFVSFTAGGLVGLLFKFIKLDLIDGLFIKSVENERFWASKSMELSGFCSGAEEVGGVAGKDPFLKDLVCLNGEFCCDWLGEVAFDLGIVEN